MALTVAVAFPSVAINAGLVFGPECQAVPWIEN